MTDSSVKGTSWWWSPLQARDRERRRRGVLFLVFAFAGTGGVLEEENESTDPCKLIYDDVKIKELFLILNLN